MTDAHDHKVIWLQPCCDRCYLNDAFDDGRLWCQEPQDPCEECGAGWIKYVRAESELLAERMARDK